MNKKSVARYMDAKTLRRPFARAFALALETLFIAVSVIVRKRLAVKSASLLFLSVFSSQSIAMVDRTFCVWDPVGRSGPVMTFYSDVIPKALAWGVNIRFDAYTEETDAVDAFKAGKCEAAVLTSILSRQFVKFAGTMDAIGAINSEKGLELAIATLARSRAGNLMIEGDYEVVTTFPVGSMYAFVRDKRVDTIEEFAGKRLAILNDDPQMKKFADLAGAKQVPVTLSTFADMFNAGDVDILIMPALAYNTFELYHGLGDLGGIVDYRLYYGMLQTIARRDQFPEQFGDKMRNYMLTRMRAMNKMVKDAEDEIPSSYWVETSQFVKDDIDHFSKRVRLALQEDDVNNSTALKLFWKIRCRLDPSRAECKSPPDYDNAVQKMLAKKKAEEAEREKARLAEQQRKQEQARIAEAKRQAELKRKEEARLAAERERIRQELLAKERQEQERLAQEKARLEAERLALEQEKIEQERLLAEQQQLEAQKLALEEQRLALETEKKELQAVEGEKRSLWDILFGWI